MWKSIVLCVSLFGGAALGLLLGARFVEESALPAAGAIGLCVIGVVLILAAPAAEAEAPGERSAVPAQRAAKEQESIDIHPVATAPNRPPARPFEAINS